MERTQNKVKECINDNRDALVNYLVQNMKNKDEQYTLSEYMWMHRQQMALSSLRALGAPFAGFSRQELLKQVSECYDEVLCLYGAYSGADGELMSTFHCFQILQELGGFGEVVRPEMAEKVRKSVVSLIERNGSVRNSPGNLPNHDTKMSYAASFVLLVLEKLYNLLFEQEIKQLIVLGIFNCYANGQFSAVPYGELHQGNTFCCISALKLLGFDVSLKNCTESQNQNIIEINPETNDKNIQQIIQFINKDKSIYQEIAFNIVKLQKNCGGFAGRPEKDPDSCYSQWSCQSLRILDYEDNELYNKQADFDLKCLIYVDQNSAGFSDFPGNQPDLWHTHYVISFLSVIDDSGLAKVSPLLNISSEAAMKIFQMQ